MSISISIKRTRKEPPRLDPLPPMKKWRAIAIATLVLVPAYWLMLAGLVSAASDSGTGPNAAASIALGLTLIPFVFIAIAFLSEHPRAPGAVVKAMFVSLGVGIPVSALAGDAVTGLVAGVGAGGIAALRMDFAHNWRARAYAVLFAAVYTFAIVRLAGPIALLPAPVFPFTALGIADHLSERRADPAASR